MDYKVTNEHLTSIANAIRTKTGSASGITFPGGFVDNITNIPTVPVVEVEENDVNFIDYDGTIVYSYTAQQFLQLNELPANPAHLGLIAQGWNWSLSDAKDYVSNYGMLDIGQMYITNDGKTRIYIHLDDTGGGDLSPRLNFAINGSGSIDWGDTQSETITGSTFTTQYKIHQYSVKGDYIISITPDSGAEIKFSASILNADGGVTGTQNALYLCTIKKVEIGQSVTSFSGAFQRCSRMKSISIPNSIVTIGADSFYRCYNLKAAVLPTSLTAIGGDCFNRCYALTKVSFPAYFTSIGASSFQYCYSLKNVSLPEGVINIGSAEFNYTALMKRISVPTTVVRIYGSSFSQCANLSNILLPEALTAIDGTAFADCSNIECVKFGSITPPTVANSNAWTNLPVDCKIYVPTGSLTAYTTTQNYPDPSVYTYIEE